LLVLAAAIGGSGPTDVFCIDALEGCEPGPGGSTEIPDSLRQKAVNRLLNG
jgi:hypothetical protein